MVIKRMGLEPLLLSKMLGSKLEGELCLYLSRGFSFSGSKYVYTSQVYHEILLLDREFNSPNHRHKIPSSVVQYSRNIPPHSRDAISRINHPLSSDSRFAA